MTYNDCYNTMSEVMGEPNTGQEFRDYDMMADWLYNSLNAAKIESATCEPAMVIARAIRNAYYIGCSHPKK